MEKVAYAAVCWVPKGKCTPRAMQEMGDAEAKERDPPTKSEAAAMVAERASKAVLHGLEEFHLEDYDEEENDGSQFFSVLENDAPLLQEKDPYLEDLPDSESEADDYEIKADDKLFLAVSCEEDTCQLELICYAADEGSMYAHHDIMLNSYPLAVEWISEAGLDSGEGSFAAVGLIDHSIQIWDIEEHAPQEPVRSLGTAQKSGKGKTKKRKYILGGSVLAHDGAVLCLHGSSFNRNVLASGSADETLKVWDVRENKCVHTYSHHTNKVQCARWHPTEQAVLLSAAFDQKLALLDVRQPGQAAFADLPAEAECAIWSRHQPFECIASVDNGGVACYDVRKIVSKGSGEEPRLFTLMAHDVACTSVQDCPTKDLLVTTGLDGHAKVWKTQPKPVMLFSKDLQAGPLFTSQASSEDPAVLCFGGKCPVVWDLSSEEVLCSAFSLPTD